MSTFVRVQYTSDDATVYQRKALAEVATALGLTTEAIGAHPKLPPNIKPRYVLGKNASTGRFFKLVGMDASDGLFTGVTTTVTWPALRNSTSTITLNRAGSMGEKRYYR